MFNLTCEHCGLKYHLEDVRVDDHWRNRWSTEAVHCYCPHCDGTLQRVQPDHVDLVKHLKFKYVVPFLLLFLGFGLGAATNTLETLGPITILGYGAWLTRTAELKENRKVGWFLLILAILAFGVLQYLSIP